MIPKSLSSLVIFYPILKNEGTWLQTIHDGKIGWCPSSCFEYLSNETIHRIIEDCKHLDTQSLPIPNQEIPVIVHKGTIMEPFNHWIDSHIHYNEIYESEGVIRKAYEKIIPIFNLIAKNPDRIDSYFEKSLKDFDGDNSLYHFPRMFTEEEHNHLLLGVRQRARALQAFINDHYQRKPNYVKDKVVSKNMISSIVARSNEKNVKKSLDLIVGSFGMALILLELLVESFLYAKII